MMTMNQNTVRSVKRVKNERQNRIAKRDERKRSERRMEEVVKIAILLHHRKKVIRTMRPRKKGAKVKVKKKNHQNHRTMPAAVVAVNLVMISTPPKMVNQNTN